MTTTTAQRDNDRGAILVHVAFALLALMAFASFSVDFGVMWASRRQAQNAADAGALAGAIAIQAKESDANAVAAATGVGRTNSVFGETPAVTAAFVNAPASDCAYPRKCIRVNAFRDTSNSNALPRFFGALMGMDNQGIRAMAIAKIGAANATDCLKPIAVPDKWIDNNGNKIYDAGDEYRPPTGANTTGYTLNDVGTVIHLKDDPGGGPGSEVPVLDNGWFRLIDITGEGGGGAQEVRQSLAACVSDVYGINDAIPNEQGEKEGARDALLDLYNLDRGAYFDNTQKKIVSTCADPGDPVCNIYVPSGPNGYTTEAAPKLTVSPRVMALPVFDPKIQAIGGTDSQGQYHPPGTLVLVNIFGFFLIPPDEVCANPYGSCDRTLNKNDFKDIWGILATKPDLYKGGAGDLDPLNAFITFVYLIR